MGQDPIFDMAKTIEENIPQHSSFPIGESSHFLKDISICTGVKLDDRLGG